MIDQYIEQLSSTDPAVRRSAVIALGRSGDVDALPYLASVYRSDPDPEIRELALKAGRYLKRQTTQDVAPQESTSQKTRDDSADDDVTPEDEERAKGYLDSAMEAQVRGNHERAADSLRKAFTINPRLRRDSYAVGLAATITGMDGAHAVEQLLTQSKVKSKKKNEDIRVGNEASWGDVVIDLLIYAVVWGGGTILLVLFLTPRFVTLLNAMAPTNPTASTQSMMSALQSIGVVSALGLGAANAVSNTIGLLLFFAAIHFAAVSMLGGEGRFTNLVHQLIPIQSIIVVVGLVATFAFIYFMFDPNLVAVSQQQARDYADSVMNTATMAICGYLLFGIVVLFYMGFQIGNVYNFGMMRGCGAQFAAWILLAIGSCCLQFAAQSVFTSMLENSLR